MANLFDMTPYMQYGLGPITYRSSLDWLFGTGADGGGGGMPGAQTPPPAPNAPPAMNPAAPQIPPMPGNVPPPIGGQPPLMPPLLPPIMPPMSPPVMPPPNTGNFGGLQSQSPGGGSFGSGFKGAGNK